VRKWVWVSDEAQTLWVVCHEFGITPSQVMTMPVDEYAFMLSGLEWWKTKEKEAIEHARH